MRRTRFLFLAGSLVLVLAQASPGVAGGGGNIRVTNDQTSAYMSADQLAGGSYSDSTLVRCGVDRRMQNEPALAIDPRNTLVRTSGSNDYCTIPTNHDAWPGFYRSTTGGTSWVDSLLPGYLLDNSPQGLASPVHQEALGGAIAGGDPVQAWDSNGDLFYMGNNFNRGVQNGHSNDFRDNTGDIWVATYAPGNNSNTMTDGSRYVRTVLVGVNTFGLGQGTDKTGIAVDPANGNVYAAWSDFHAGGCNEIDLARSTDHGATFSIPMKISGSICNNQGPNIAIGPQGQVYVSWSGQQSGTKGQATRVQGAAFVASTDGGRSFGMANIVVPFNGFSSDNLSGNGARECGDVPFNCPNGDTFPRFDLTQPSITTNGNNVDMVFPARLVSGQGQIQFVASSDGGATWSTATAVDPQTVGHQFMPWITASAGVLHVVYYDSRADGSNYSPNRAPCNSATGVGSACLNVWYSTSSNNGASWTHVQVTDKATNPNFEQFGGRRVPFFGDYIMVAAVGRSVEAVWTDSRDVVAGTEPATGTDADKNDVAGDPETGGSCTSSFTDCFDHTGGLDQNIYTQVIS